MIKNRFSEKSEPIEISEDELYRSSNCGITTCTQSIAGIIAINGLDELLIKGRLAIERDLYARGKNNIKSLLGGLEILKNNESDFKKNIQEINKLHKDLLLNIGNYSAPPARVSENRRHARPARSDHLEPRAKGRADRGAVAAGTSAHSPGAAAASAHTAP